MNHPSIPADQKQRIRGYYDAHHSPTRPVSDRTLRRADSPQAYVGRASTDQLKALLADKRYASWRPIINAELSRRRKAAGSGGNLDDHRKGNS